MPRPFRDSAFTLGALLLALMACRSSAAVADAQRPAPAAQEPGAELVIGRAQYGTTVQAAVGQRFRVARPPRVERWTIEYADEVIRLLDPPEDRSRPGPEGWRFEAIAEGETTVTLTSGSAGEVPPMGFAFTIQVKARGA